MTQFRQIVSQHIGHATSDGAGVSLTRVFGGAGIERFDPFLMLDEFGSENPDEYIAGFPPHPHRGFETITYMLEGRMRHEDHLGNVGLLESGGVQWMTAARGIIHSEMPEQEEGLMRGFQLWLNLPSQAKLGDADYRDYAPQEIPLLRTAGGVEVKVIAGRFDDGEQQQDGAVQRPQTDPQLYDFDLPAGSRITPHLADGQRVLLYVYEGDVFVNGQLIGKRRLARLSQQGAIELVAQQHARVLLIAGTPLEESIVQYGPFVMNTREQIEEALRDFRDGRLTA